MAIVTAAGYPGDAKRYEQRLSGLLHGFKNSNVNPDNLENFYVFGGECNVNLCYSNNPSFCLDTVQRLVHSSTSIKILINQDG